jgi:hypothetical protein
MNVFSINDRFSDYGVAQISAMNISCVDKFSTGSVKNFAASDLCVDNFFHKKVLKNLQFSFLFLTHTHTHTHTLFRNLEERAAKVHFFSIANLFYIFLTSISKNSTNPEYPFSCFASCIMFNAGQTVSIYI